MLQVIEGNMGLENNFVACPETSSCLSFSSNGICIHIISAETSTQGPANIKFVRGLVVWWLSLCYIDNAVGMIYALVLSIQ